MRSLWFLLTIGFGLSAKPFRYGIEVEVPKRFPFATTQINNFNDSELDYILERIEASKQSQFHVFNLLTTEEALKLLDGLRASISDLEPPKNTVEWAYWYKLKKLYLEKQFGKAKIRKSGDLGEILTRTNSARLSSEGITKEFDESHLSQKIAYWYTLFDFQNARHRELLKQYFRNHGIPVHVTSINMFPALYEKINQSLATDPSFKKFELSLDENPGHRAEMIYKDSFVETDLGKALEDIRALDGITHLHLSEESEDHPKKLSTELVSHINESMLSTSSERVNDTTFIDRVLRVGNPAPGLGYSSDIAQRSFIREIEKGHFEIRDWSLFGSDSFIEMMMEKGFFKGLSLHGVRYDSNKKFDAYEIFQIWFEGAETTDELIADLKEVKKRSVEKSLMELRKMSSKNTYNSLKHLINVFSFGNAHQIDEVVKMEITQNYHDIFFREETFRGLSEEKREMVLEALEKRMPYPVLMNFVSSLRNKSSFVYDAFSHKDPCSGALVGAKAGT